MANILLNYQTNNLRYAVNELTDHNLYSWRALGNEFAKNTVIPLHDNLIDNVDIFEKERGDLAKGILAYIEEKDIDLIFPLYNDMMFPYLYKKLGFTDKQCNILSSKQAYTAFAKSVGVTVPNTYTDIKQVTYPIIAKPVNGTGSIGVKVLNDYSEYFFFASGEDIQYNDLGKHYIFQDFIDGPTISCAGRIVDGDILFDCVYTIESSDLPYRAETGFLLNSYYKNTDPIKEQIEKLSNGLELTNCAWMADFISGRDGQFYLVDFSPRLSVSAQVLIKHSAGIDYNKLIVDSLLYKDKTKVHLDKCVVYKYFDVAKGKHKVEFRGDATLADELTLPAEQSYLTRMDMLMGSKGFCVTSGATLTEAHDKWQTIASDIIITKLD
jgi:predicted ATP-grasp superfamily ATP-dependent carboligase